MEDSKIIELFLARKEEAIRQTDAAYGQRLYHLANRIVRLKQDADGAWWRTSSTEHYAEFDTRISEEEAQAILNSYTPLQLETHPLSEFKEPD